MSKQIPPFKLRVQNLVKFCEENNRMPRPKSSGGSDYEGSLRSFSYTYRFNKTVRELREKYKINKTFDENLTELRSFCKRYKRLPKSYNGDPECRLNSFMNRHKNDKRIIKINDIYKPKPESQYSINKSNWITELENFCKTHGRLPNSNHDKYESYLSGLRNRNKNNKKVVRITEMYRSRSKPKNYDENYKDLYNFVNLNKRLPRMSIKGDERRLASFMTRYNYKDEVSKLVRDYKSYNGYKDNLDELIEFILLNDKLPKYNGKDKNEFRLCAFMTRHRNEIEINELITKYKS